ncbi:hypothetical protein GGR50DRAFT_677201 [Xylaria sp. CBS 124048]|nr:hypothetical protein GGR50DRAFT_677201 [Xylaria sp. CBS 124048]
MAEETTRLPSAPMTRLAENATLQPPLTRRGHGPGLILLTPGDRPAKASEEKEDSGKSDTETLDPLPQKKWAEEGYAVVKLDFGHGGGSTACDVATALSSAIEALDKLDTCDFKDRFGLIVYGTPTDYPPTFTSQLKETYNTSPKLIVSVSFSLSWDLTTKPQLLHLPGPPSSSPSLNPPHTKSHHYPSAKSPLFIHPLSPTYQHSAASLAHTRTLTFLKPHLNGPYFDLEAIWDEHTALEFATRSVERTMATMVDEPYVNHVPVLTGGMGRASLTTFYRDHFIFCNPADTGLELVSRTVGVDRVVDEFIAVLTHDRVVDWLLPGVPPTHKPLRIPMTSVVNVRGDRLYHEHISWDQGTVLRQLGLLPAYLPFPYPVPGGTAAAGTRWEYRVPVFGVETAVKLADAGAVGSNEALGFAVREVEE